MVSFPGVIRVHLSGVRRAAVIRSLSRSLEGVALRLAAGRHRRAHEPKPRAPAQRRARRAGGGDIGPAGLTVPRVQQVEAAARLHAGSRGTEAREVIQVRCGGDKATCRGECNGDAFRRLRRDQSSPRRTGSCLSFPSASSSSRRLGPRVAAGRPAPGWADAPVPAGRRARCGSRTCESPPRRSAARLDARSPTLQT